MPEFEVAFFEDLLGTTTLIILEKRNQARLKCLSALHILDKKLCEVNYGEMLKKLQAFPLFIVGLGFE